MTRRLSIGAFGVGLFALAMAYFAWLDVHGFVGGDALDLWGEAIAARDGALNLRSIVLTFPPAPHLATMAMQLALGASGISTPNVLSAMLVALTGALWLSSFQRAGHGTVAGFVMALLLVLNPAFLRLASAGPALVMLSLGCWLAARAAYRLRARDNIVDLMSLSGGLALVALSHPLGCVVVLALSPYLVFVVQPHMTRDSLAGAYLTILFPAALALSGALYGAWVFQGDLRGLLAYLTSPPAMVDDGSSWMVNAWRRHEIPAIAGLSIAALCATPALFGAFVANGRRLPRVLPTAALIASLPAAGVLAGVLGVVNEPLTIIAPGLGFAAAALAIWPQGPSRAMWTTGLLLAGAIGAGGLIFSAPSRETRDWMMAIRGVDIVTSSSADLAVGEFLAPRADVAIDARGAPRVLAGRRSARGLLLPTGFGFEMTRLSRRTSARFLAVRATSEVVGGLDAVNAIFPDLYEKGAPDYIRIYDRLGWRVYQRATMAASR